MKKPRHIGRRSFLLGLGGSVLAIPTLASLSTTRAQESSTRKFISYKIPNGHFGQQWYPADAAVEAAGGLRPLGENVIGLPLRQLSGDVSTLLHAGFDPFREKISVLRHLDRLNHANHNAYTGLLGWSEDRLPDDPSRMAPSIDQIMAEHVFLGESIPLNLTFFSYGSRKPSCSFTIGPSGPVPVPGLGAEEAFQLLFAGTTLEPSVAERRREHTRNVVDYVLPHYRDVRSNPRLSADDRYKLDQHIEHMHAVSARLGMRRGACMPPPTPEGLERSSENVTAMSRELIDIGIAALRCGLTSIVNFYIDPDVLFTHDLHGVEGGHHGASHGAAAAAVQSIENAHLWHMENVLNLLHGLDGTATDTGTLLDESALLVHNEIGNQAGRDNTPGNYDLNHMCYDAQVLVAGSCGGRLQQGQYLDFRSGFERGRWTRHVGTAYNRLDISMMIAMGCEPHHWEVDGEPGFGDLRGDKWGRTPLDEVIIGDLRAGLPGLMA